MCNYDSIKLKDSSNMKGKKIMWDICLNTHGFSSIYMFTTIHRGKTQSENTISAYNHNHSIGDSHNHFS